MPVRVITSVDQVTPELLSSILSKSAAITCGAVAAFSIDTSRGNWSSNSILHLGYAPGSQGASPERLFLKMVNADLEDEFFGPSEVLEYMRDYTDVENAPLIHCYDAAYSAEQLRYHVLLDDVSEIHIEAAEKAPALEYGFALAEGLAAMHARW